MTTGKWTVRFTPQIPGHYWYTIHNKVLGEARSYLIEIHRADTIRALGHEVHDDDDLVIEVEQANDEPSEWRGVRSWTRQWGEHVTWLGWWTEPVLPPPFPTPDTPPAAREAQP